MLATGHNPTRKTTVTRLAQVALPLLTVGLVTAACSSSGSGYGAKPPGTGSGSSPANTAGAIKLTDGHLTDAAGRTVFLWVADTTSKSTCNGTCATVWPAVPASGTPSAGSGLRAGLLTTSTRSDGTTQLDYNGHPLYYYASDTTPGSTTGQGSDSFGAKWWEVDAAGNAVTSSSAPSSSSGSSSTHGGYGY